MNRVKRIGDPQRSPTLILPPKTGNYLLERRLRGRRRPGETLFASLEEARKDALEVAQEADAPPKARTEDAAAVTAISAKVLGGAA